MTCGCSCIKADLDLFNLGIEQTRACMEAHPGIDPVRCEMALLSPQDDYTYHTHPGIDGQDINYPSHEDIDTTVRLGKKFLCIGLVNSGNTVCYSADDGFSEIKCMF